MACVETVCHERQNITSSTVLNMFLWFVLNRENFEYTLCRNRATASESKCAFKHMFEMRRNNFLKSTTLN